MYRSLLAVGAAQTCSELIPCALVNRWRVFHTLLLEDIPVALKRSKLDMIVLLGNLTSGWERAAEGLWAAGHLIPVIVCNPMSPVAGLDVLLSGGAASLGNPSGIPQADRPCRRSALSPSLSLMEPLSDTVSHEIAMALDFLEKEYQHPLTLADAARAACYSRCHFSKVFKVQVGISFVAYLTQVRIQHATELLAGTDHSVTEVAFGVGFNDLSHFERVFRASTSQAPLQYRQNAKHLLKHQQ